MAISFCERVLHKYIERHGYEVFKRALLSNHHAYILNFKKIQRFFVECSDRLCEYRLSCVILA